MSLLRAGTTLFAICMQGAIASEHATQADLEESLSNCLADKAAIRSDPPGAQPNSPPAPAQSAEQQPQMQPPRSTPPTTATATATATAVQQRVEVNEQPPPEIPSEGPSGDGFLNAMQSMLEQAGYDLTSVDTMLLVASDPAFADRYAPWLAQYMMKDANIMHEWVRQWQQAIKQQMLEEQQRAKKGQRPVWRCARCEKYGCPVQPYIESFEEVDL